MHVHLLTELMLVVAFIFIDRDQLQGSVSRIIIASNVSFVLKVDNTEGVGQSFSTAVDTVGIVVAASFTNLRMDQQHTVAGLLEGHIPSAMARSPFMVFVDCSTF